MSTGTPAEELPQSRQDDAPEGEDLEQGTYDDGSGRRPGGEIPEQWENLQDAPVVRADGVPMYRRRTGRRVRGADFAQPARSRGMQSLRDAGTVVMAALLISFVSQHVLVSGYLVTDDAMEPTLQPGDRVFANVLDLTVTEADRGDIVVFERPRTWEPDPTNPLEDPSPLQRGLTFLGLLPDQSADHDVKRVIGVGGDRVSCCDAQGRIMVNDQPIDEAEAYLYPGEIASDIPFDVIVPDHHYFVLGDYRSASSDARHRLMTDQAFVGHELVEGTAFVVGWPLNRMGPLPDGSEVFSDDIASRPSARGGE